MFDISKAYWKKMSFFDKKVKYSGKYLQITKIGFIFAKNNPWKTNAEDILEANYSFLL